MRRGTTPTHRVVINEDVTDYNLRLAYKAGGKLVVKTGASLDVSLDDGKTIIVCTLTQRDTLGFKAGDTCEVQVRGERASGAIAFATTIGRVPVERILEDGEIGGA